MEVGNLTVPVSADLGPITKQLEQLKRALGQAESQTNGVSSTVRKLDASLASVTPRITNLTAALARLTVAETRNTALSYNDRANEIAAYGQELDRLRAKYNPIFAASKRYETELNELNRAHRLGAITAVEYGSALTNLNNRYTASSAAVNTYSANAGVARHQTQNLMYQFQDIGTMMAMGQNPFMLLAQQLPQVVQHGGKLNGVMDALKQTFGGLLSPLGLLTTGFVLAGSALISYLTSAADESDEVSVALENQRRIISSVADEWGNALPALKAYADERERLANINRQREATDLVIEDVYSSLTERVGELNVGLADTINQMQILGASDSAIVALQRAYSSLTTAVGDGTASAEDLRKVSEALGILFNDTSSPAVRNLAKEFENLADSIDNAKLRADALRSDLAIQEFFAQTSLGTIGPVYSGGGAFIDENQLQTQRANAAKSQYQIEQDALNKRKSRMSAEQRENERLRKAYEALIRDSKMFIEQQELERASIGMTELETARLRHQTDLLNQARRAGINLTPEQVRNLTDLGNVMAEAEIKTKKLKEQYDFAKDTFKGFFTDLKSELQNGASIWEAFGNAAANALQKIADKLLDMALNGLFDILLGALGGGFGTSDGFRNMIGYENGTSYAAGGWAVVGERGPELMKLPAGTQVQSNNRVMSPSQASFGGGGMGGESRVALEVFVRDDGKIGAIARQEAGAVVETTIREYDSATLPQSMQRVSNHPRMRNATA